MAFLNGTDWGDSSGLWNRQRSTANTATNHAYAEDLLQASTGTLKYYINDVLIYTSEATPTNLYPFVNFYEDNASITINSDYNTTKRIDFTLNNVDSTGISNTGLGLNSTTNGTGWTLITNVIAWDDGKYQIREGYVVKVAPTTYAPSNGDVLSLAWESPPSTGTRLPPPPIILSGL